MLAALLVTFYIVVPLIVIGQTVSYFLERRRREREDGG